VEKSVILVACEGGLAYVQVKGRGSFQNAGNLKRFYTEVIGNSVTQCIIDLKLCTYLDSTFLGTLTGLGLKLKALPGGRMTVIHVSTRNLELMQNMGLDRLFHLQANASDYSPEALEETSARTETKRETGQVMLEAHENLMGWDERNVAKFKDVVDYLREDLGQSE
jgi:anti-sigma B factor antagonist